MNELLQHKLDKMANPEKKTRITYLQGQLRELRIQRKNKDLTKKQFQATKNPLVEEVNELTGRGIRKKRK